MISLGVMPGGGTRASGDGFRTQAGEGALARLRLILLEIDEAADQAREHSSEISGHLRVATTSLVAVNLLAPCVADFQRQHPGVQVEIHTTDRPAQELQEREQPNQRQRDRAQTFAEPVELKLQGRGDLLGGSQFLHPISCLE